MIALAIYIGSLVCATVIYAVAMKKVSKTEGANAEPSPPPHERIEDYKHV